MVVETHLRKVDRWITSTSRRHILIVRDANECEYYTPLHRATEQRFKKKRKDMTSRSRRTEEKRRRKARCEKYIHHIHRVQKY